MMYPARAPRAQCGCRTRRRSPFRPALERLEERITPTGLPWIVDADPDGTVFVDANLNGKFDSGETPLAGWTVWLDVSREGVLDPGEPVMTTDANGHYAFITTNLPPALTLSDGTLADIVRVDLQVGSGGRWLNTTSTDVVINRTTTPNATGVDFGMTFQPTVGVAPVGPESLVNVTTAGQQGATAYAIESPASASADALGDYVVAWRTYVPGGVDVISARVFNPDGSARTGEITVGTGSSPSDGYTAMPEVAMAGNGQFTVAWVSYIAQRINSLFARTYRLDGSAITGTVTLLAGDATTTGGLFGVAEDATGNSAVLYSVETKSKNWGWSGPTFKVQRYTPVGAPNGSAVTVASPSLVNGAASIGMAGAGNFVVAWDEAVGSRGGTNTTDVYAQQFTAAGRKSGSQLTVASGTTTASGETLRSSVAMSVNGQFAVTYEVTGTVAQRLARIYSASGTPAGAAIPFTVGDVVDGEPAAVAMDGAGNVTFAWTSMIPRVLGKESPYDLAEVRVRRLTAAGVLEPATIVNTTTQGGQALPGLAATGSGTFVVAWQGYGPGDDAGIFAQRLAPLSPQLPATGIGPGGAAALTQSALTPIVHQAINAWIAAGLTPSQVAALNQVQFSIQNLSASGALGLTALHSSVVLLDATAEGWGWFIDPTPADSAEFRVPVGGRERHALPGSPAFGHIDLLTVVEHELGHVLGLDDIGRSAAAHDLMTTTLAPGTRRGPSALDRIALHHATAGSAALIR